MEPPGSAGTRRAPRFALVLPLKYRVGGERFWSEAVALNVSRTGVLIWPGHSLPPGRPVEVVLTLPPCEAYPNARVRCSTQVVRTGRDGLALQIEHYRFLRPAEDARREGPAIGASDA